MKNTSKYSVSDAAILYKKSRATLYKDIKNGILSRDHDGSIDFSELLRVYGEPFDGKQIKRLNTSAIQSENTPEYNENTFIELKNQIDFLKKQLEKAEDRENKANARIDTLLTLIEMKPVQTNMTTFTDYKSEPDVTKETLKSVKEGVEKVEVAVAKNPRIPVPEHVEPEPEKRGFWSRFFKPYG